MKKTTKNPSKAAAKSVKTKKIAKQKKLLLPLAAVAAALVIVAVWAAFFYTTVPRGWERTNVEDLYEVYHPADWNKADNIGYAMFDVAEPADTDTQKYRIMMPGTNRLVAANSAEEAKSSASMFSAIWVGHVGKDGKVYRLVKTPLCTEHDKIMQIAGGYYRCDADSDEATLRTIGVVLDVTEYSQAEFYDEIAGRRYDVLTIECLEGVDSVYPFERTCKDFALNIRKLRE